MAELEGFGGIVGVVEEFEGVCVVQYVFIFGFIFSGGGGGAGRAGSYWGGCDGLGGGGLEGEVMAHFILFIVVKICLDYTQLYGIDQKLSS